jgi:hypothetical protein
MDDIDREWADWDLTTVDDEENEDEDLPGGAAALAPLDPDDPRNEGGASVKIDRELVLV